MNLQLSPYLIGDVVMVNMSEVVVNFSNTINMLGNQVIKKRRLRLVKERKYFLYFAPLLLLVLCGKQRANITQLCDAYHPVEGNIL